MTSGFSYNRSKMPCIGSCGFTQTRTWVQENVDPQLHSHVPLEYNNLIDTTMEKFLYCYRASFGLYDDSKKLMIIFSFTTWSTNYCQFCYYHNSGYFIYQTSSKITFVSYIIINQVSFLNLVHYFNEKI